MEKRVFLAIFLSFVVLGLYQAFLAPPMEPVVAPPPASVAPGSAAAPVPGQTAAPLEQAAPVQPVATPGPAALVADSAAREIVVETDAIRAVFWTEGATLKSWQLKRYREHEKSTEPLELIPQGLPANLDRAFALGTTDPSISSRLARALFKPSANGPLDFGTSAGTLSFQYTDESGLNARKTFHFQPDGKPYLLTVEAAIDVNSTSLPVVLKFGPALRSGEAIGGSQHVKARGLLFRQGEVERIAAATLIEQPRHEGELGFAGVEEQYFLTGALPPPAQSIRVDYEPLTLPVAGGAPEAVRSLVAFRISAPGAVTLPFFLGPKDFEVLRAVEPQFVRAIDFGIFAWLVVPMLQALKWLNGYIGNFGWSIVLLTVLINLAMFPLRHRSMVSMRKMQALQPEVKAIQERYAKYKLSDPERQKMNQEMMALYKQKSVNPASGCVPMLLTMPILFAFYAMLQVAIEIRHAPFFGWVTDLSEQDPYYIWPLLMGATMFWQQRITPTTADPVQARIFMFMPVIFTVTFLWFPAGLVVYWLSSNLMAIGQQYLTNRIIGVPAGVRAIRASGPPKPQRANNESNSKS